MTAMLSMDRDRVRYRRALRQIRFDLESSAVPRALRDHIFKLIDDALAGVTEKVSEKAHR